MIVALIFISTSILQFFFYFKNNEKGKPLSDYLITIITILIYLIVYPFLIYNILGQSNLMNFSFTFQTVIIGVIGIIFSLVTNLFWFIEKKRIE